MDRVVELSEDLSLEFVLRARPVRRRNKHEQKVDSAVQGKKTACKSIHKKHKAVCRGQLTSKA